MELVYLVLSLIGHFTEPKEPKTSSDIFIPLCLINSLYLLCIFLAVGHGTR